MLGNEGKLTEAESQTDGISPVPPAMELNTEVILPRGRIPRFPDRCVSCGLHSPGESIRIATRAVGRRSWALWSQGRSNSINVPTCRDCGRRIRLRRSGAALAVAGLVLLVFMVLEPVIASLSHTAFHGWILAFSLIACLSPWLLTEIFYPQPISLTTYAESVVYEFRDGVYARDFAVLNEASDENDLVNSHLSHREARR
jgi:hypothetical protein